MGPTPGQPTATDLKTFSATGYVMWNLLCLSDHSLLYIHINLLAPAPPGPLRVFDAGRWLKIVTAAIDCHGNHVVQKLPIARSDQEFLSKVTVTVAELTPSAQDQIPGAHICVQTPPKG